MLKPTVIRASNEIIDTPVMFLCPIAVIVIFFVVFCLSDCASPFAVLILEKFKMVEHLLKLLDASDTDFVAISGQFGSQGALPLCYLSEYYVWIFKDTRLVVPVQ